MFDNDYLVLVMTTVASAEDADKLAQAMVEQSLAACVQIDGPIVSHYRWNGKLERAEEFRLSIKTVYGKWLRLREMLTQSHPYDEPEIVMMPIGDVSQGYRDWVIDQTS